MCARGAEEQQALDAGTGGDEAGDPLQMALMQVALMQMH
jgi:hypothetical protein